MASTGFAAPAVAADGPADAGDRVVRRALAYEPETLDPEKSTGIPEAEIIEDLLEGLTTFGADASTQPGQAERWDISPDGRTYTFHLRPGLTWSDGAPLTSADYLYSWRREVDPKTASPYSSMLDRVVNAEAIVSGEIKDLTKLGIAAPDAQTVVVTLVRPTAYFLKLLCHHATFAVPRQAIEQWGTEWTRPGHNVASGAYLLSDWVPQSHLSLIRNPRFHDAAQVKIGRVERIIEPDNNTSFQKYRAGELDEAFLPPAQIAIAKSTLPQDLREEPYLGVKLIYVNLGREPLGDNLKLRQALALAMDSRVLQDKVVRYGQVPAFGLVPTGLDGYPQQSVFYHDTPMPERLAKAKQLYAEAGYGPDHPLKVTLLYPTDRDVGAREYAALQSMWKQALGVELTLDNREWQVYEAQQRRRDFELSFGGWIADYADPYTFFEIFRSDAGGLNYTGYHNAAFDRLTDEAELERDPAKRMAKLAEAEKLLLDDQIILPDAFYVKERLVNPKLTGWVANLMSQHLSRYLAFKDPA